MAILEQLEDASASIGVAVVSSIGAALAWLVRRIFTNQKQIELLQREIQIRDQRRDEDRQALGEVRTDVREMRAEIREIFQRR